VYKLILDLFQNSMFIFKKYCYILVWEVISIYTFLPLHQKIGYLRGKKTVVSIQWNHRNIFSHLLLFRSENLLNDAVAIGISDNPMGLNQENMHATIFPNPTHRWISSSLSLHCRAAFAMSWCTVFFLLNGITQLVLITLNNNCYIF